MPAKVVSSPVQNTAGAGTPAPAKATKPLTEEELRKYLTQNGVTGIAQDKAVEANRSKLTPSVPPSSAGPVTPPPAGTETKTALGTIVSKVDAPAEPAPTNPAPVKSKADLLREQLAAAEKELADEDAAAAAAETKKTEENLVKKLAAERASTAAAKKQAEVAAAAAAKKQTDEKAAADLVAAALSGAAAGVTDIAASATTETESDEDYARRLADEAAMQQPAPGAAESTGAAPDTEDEAQPGTERLPALQNQWSQRSHGAITGDVDRSDFKTPQLKIIQGSGKETANHTAGELVFLDQAIFRSPTADKPSPAIRVIPLELHKYFREEPKPEHKALPIDQRPKPRNVLTKAEVERLGGTTEWTGSGDKRIKPTWSPAARCLVLLEKPQDGLVDGDHPGFSMAVEVNGVVRYFAPAVFYVNGGAYRGFAKPVLDATQFILVEGDAIVVEKRVWSMVITKVVGDEWTTYAPRLSILPELTPEPVRQAIGRIRGTPAS